MKYEYIPIDYFSFNRPEYFAAIIVIIMFAIFTIILFWVFKYEYFKRIEYCDPMYYYGQPCRNDNSNLVLLDPKFIEMKKIYYDAVAKFNDETGEYEGVRTSTAKNSKKVEKAEKNINDNIKRNEEFTKTSIEEIEKITTVTNLIASKYLGNIEDILRNIHNAPDYVLESIKGLPEHLAQLRIQIQDSIVNPLFKQYTAPLQKLYRSLTDLDKKTLPYIEKKNK
tara:strand:- start:364 stop:1035 length:672 start_codon:yes stop_codon:yes gene_type:complete